MREKRRESRACSLAAGISNQALARLLSLALLRNLARIISLSLSLSLLEISHRERVIGFLPLLDTSRDLIAPILWPSDD
jgi:hypothetical protein